MNAIVKDSAALEAQTSGIAGAIYIAAEEARSKLSGLANDVLEVTDIDKLKEQVVKAIKITNSLTEELDEIELDVTSLEEQFNVTSE